MADYPFVKFHFKVDWGGTEMGFAEVSGLNVHYEVIEYHHGLDPEYTDFKMPGRSSWDNVVLKRGTCKSNNEFFEWVTATKLNKPERKDVTISLLDETHSPVVTWVLKNAWPASFESTDLVASDSEIAIETLELAHEGFTIEMQ